MNNEERREEESIQFCSNANSFTISFKTNLEI